MENVTKRKVSKNIAYNFISQILTLIVPLVTAPYLARVLRETGNGRYSYSFSIITYFIMFASMGFDIYGQRQIAFYQDSQEKKSKIFAEIFILKLIFTLISLTVLLSIIFTIGFGEKYNKLVLIMAIQVAVIPLDVQYFFKGEENFRSIAIRTIVLKIISLICIFVFVKKMDDVWIYALCISLSVLFSNVIMWPSLFVRLSKIDRKDITLKDHIKPALLIFLPTLAVTVYSVFDKTMIGLLAKNPDYENGCYEQAYKLNSILLLPVTIISAVFVSRNASDYSKFGYDGIRKNLYFAFNYVWLLGVPMIFGGYLLYSNLCSWFLGNGYDKVPLLLQIMSIRFLVSGFSEIVGNQLFIAVGKEKYSLIATLFAAVINVGLNFILIPKYGAVGAAITTAISEMIVTFILIFFVMKKKVISLLCIVRMSIKYVISSSIMFVVIYYLNGALNVSIFSFLLIVTISVILYFILLLTFRDKFLLARLYDIRKILFSRSNNIDEKDEL